MANRRNSGSHGREDRFTWKAGDARIFKTEAEADAWLREGEKKLQEQLRSTNKKKTGTTAKKKK